MSVCVYIYIYIKLLQVKEKNQGEEKTEIENNSKTEWTGLIKLYAQNNRVNAAGHFRH